MSDPIKHDFTATGQSAEFTARRDSVARYFADFATGSGVGTVQLQVQAAGDWIPAAAALMTSSTTAGIFDAPSEHATVFRWNCSAYTSGTITVYIF